MVRRAGRKRRIEAVRAPDGRAKVEITTFRPFNMQNVIEGGDERAGTMLYRKSVLEQICHQSPQVHAGQAFAHLWEQCRVHYLDGPPASPKAVSMDSGFGHPAELTEDMIRHGVRVRERYDEALRALGKHKDNVRVVHALFSVCVENKPIAECEKRGCRDGLMILANLWGL